MLAARGWWRSPPPRRQGWRASSRARQTQLRAKLCRLAVHPAVFASLPDSRGAATSLLARACRRRWKLPVCPSSQLRLRAHRRHRQPQQRCQPCVTPHRRAWSCDGHTYWAHSTLEVGQSATTANTHALRCRFKYIFSSAPFVRARSLFFVRRSCSISIARAVSRAVRGGRTKRVAKYNRFWRRCCWPP